MDLKQFNYRVIAPCLPYLGRPERGKPKEIVVVSYPFEDSSYTYEEAVDVLRIFTDRWFAGGARPVLEPYMKALPEDLGVMITMTALLQRGDADEFIALLRTGVRPERPKPQKLKRGRKPMRPRPT